MLTKSRKDYSEIYFGLCDVNGLQSLIYNVTENFIIQIFNINYKIYCII